jgi:hypothetical protein
VKRRLLPLAVSGALIAILALSASLVPAAVGQAVGTHGIGFAKGCDSPVNVGGPYNCGFLVANSPLIDSHGDDLTITSLTDVPRCGRRRALRRDS